MTLKQRYRGASMRTCLGLFLKFTVICGIIGAILWLLTGGIVIFRHEEIMPTFHNDDNRPLILVDVDRSYHSSGIPFLCEVHTDEIPFSLEMNYLTHHVVDEPIITIKSFVVEYDDGTVDHLQDRIALKLIPKRETHRYVDAGGNEQREPCLRGRLRLDQCITQRSSFTLKLSIVLQSQDRIVEEKELTLRFNATTKVDLYPTWIWHLIGKL